PSRLIGGGGAPVELRITGADFTQLAALANQVLGIVQSTPGVVEPRTTTIDPSPEFRAIIDRQRAGDLGITAQTLATTLNAAVGGVVASEFRPEGQNQVDIVLQLKGAETLTAAQLGAIPIITPSGDLVTLDSVAAIVPSSTPAQISRFNRARGIEVQSNVSGRALGDVLR